MKRSTRFSTASTAKTSSTRKSAKSPILTEERLTALNAAVAGLGGPKRGLSILLAGTSVNYFIVNMIRKADPNMPFIADEDDEKWAISEIKRLGRETEKLKEKILELVPAEFLERDLAERMKAEKKKTRKTAR